MARRTQSLVITQGDDYTHRLEVTVDGAAMDVSAYTVTSSMHRGGVTQAFTVDATDAATGVLLFTLTDLETVDLEGGQWRFSVLADLGDNEATWLTGTALVGTTGSGADLTTIESVDDATALVIETAGILIPAEGGGGGGAPSGPAGGVLAGTYPNPSFAVDMATQAELNTEATTRATADTNEATARATADGLLIPLTQKAAANGVATLDASTLIPDAQIPSTITRDSELTAAIQAAIDALLDGAPGALDTLNELAAAVNDDASFAATVTTALAAKVDKATLTTDGDLLTRAAGAMARITRASLAADSAWASVYVALTDARLTDARTPTAHAASHASAGSDAVTLAQSQVTNLATDLATKAPLASPAFTGNPTAPTPTAGDNDTSIATTEFVTTAVAGVSGGSFDLAQQIAFGG